MIIEADGYNLICEETGDGLVITGYEGSGALLDLSSQMRLIGIDKKAFLCCKSLRKVSLPQNIRHMGDWCFSKCDNLESVSIDIQPSGEIFGRGVFEGCVRLKEIVFKNAGPDLSVLLAAGVSHMANDHLLRSDDIGQNFWYEKWDLSLLSMITSQDTESSKSVPLGGEEDISYDGVGSVDGEMSGETNEYVKRIATDKCRLCYMRLLHDTYLSDGHREKIEEYIKDRAYGSRYDWAWMAINEDAVNGPEYMRIYLDVVRPDREEMKAMIESISATGIQTKAYLISEAGKQGSETSALDDLFI